MKRDGVSFVSDPNYCDIKKIDSLHLACAIKANADYFLTTDDGVIKKAIHIQNIQIVDPIGFIKEVLI